MSDGPISRPLEQSEISRLSGGDPYRFEMLYSQKNMERVITEMHGQMQAMNKWQIEHDKKDDLRHLETTLKMKALENSIEGKGGVRSSVNDYEDNKQQFKGAWKAIAILFTVVTVIAGGLSWAWDHLIAFFSKGQS